jgi:predicted dienelactone hydrolase
MRALFLPVLCVSTCVACAPPDASTREALPFAPADGDNAPDPGVVGPYPVGVITTLVVDDLRTNEDGTFRQLPLEVWYPAAESARGAAQEVLSFYDVLPDDVREGLTRQDLGELATIAVRDAEPRHDDDDTYPLIAFSHGKGGIRTQSNYYTAFLASHGYVVVAPDHTGDTLVELLREVKGTGEIQQSSTVEALANRPDDIAAVLDLVKDVVSDDIASLINDDLVGVTGHSFGSLTSFIVASRDYRVDAVVGQAPTSAELVNLQAGTPMEELLIPSLVQSATLDNTLPEAGAQHLYEALAGPKAWLSLARGGHFTYSDLCVLDAQAVGSAIGLDVSNVLDDGCGPDALPAEEAFPLINTTAVGFFNQQLRKSPGSAEFVTQAAVDALSPGEANVVSEKLSP